MVNAPVLLAGDIDRGGVFAQLYGTVELLEPEEKKLIKGTIVNKFRGDKAILEPGLRQLEELCGVPVAGVIPYLHLDIDDEDSLTERFDNRTERRLIDIAVIRIPKISNFTDFAAFDGYENLSVRYVDRVADLGDPDMIIIPGTKSTIADLKWLRESGMEAKILQAADHGKLIFGICGGYQMLGRSVADPEMTEAETPETIKGMGLLPIETVFVGEKRQTQTSGTLPEIPGELSELSGLGFEGYEIHMGRSGNDLPQIVSMSDSEDCNVYGSYIHGIFDAPGIADTVVRVLCKKRGVDPSEIGTFDRMAYKDQQYDLLAKHMRENMDMDLVYRIINEQ
jgi:adenosylcobyric acid synthase